MNKYIGESEGNMMRNLARLDQEEPGIVLFDEVEKAVSKKNDLGSTSTLRSQLLWWLAEHRFRWGRLAVTTTSAYGKGSTRPI